MCDGQRTTLGVIHSSGMSTLFFEIGFLPGLELVKYAGLASQQVSEICLSLLHHSQNYKDYKHTTPIMLGYLFRSLFYLGGRIYVALASPEIICKNIPDPTFFLSPRPSFFTH